MLVSKFINKIILYLLFYFIFDNNAKYLYCKKFILKFIIYNNLKFSS